MKQQEIKEMQKTTVGEGLDLKVEEALVFYAIKQAGDKQPICGEQFDALNNALEDVIRAAYGAGCAATLKDAGK